MLWISDKWKDYEVLDASNGERLERWGDYILAAATGQTTICRNAGRSNIGIT